MRYFAFFLVIVWLEVIFGEPRTDDQGKLLSVTFDADVIYQLLFGDFLRGNYMAEVEKEGRIEFEDGNCKVYVFSEGSQAYPQLKSDEWVGGEVRFSICVIKSKKDLYPETQTPHLKKFHILEEIFYEFNGRLVTRITIERIGTQIDLTDIEKLWNFELPRPDKENDEYRFTILAEPIYGELLYGELRYNRRKRETSVTFNEQGEGIIISEKPINLDLLRSRRTIEWINCKQCGEVPSLNIIEEVTEPNYHPQTYFISSQEVGRGRFLEVLNQAFAMPLAGIGRGLKMNLIFKWNWPNR